MRRTTGIRGRSNLEFFALRAKTRHRSSNRHFSFVRPKLASCRRGPRGREGGLRAERSHRRRRVAPERTSERRARRRSPIARAGTVARGSRSRRAIRLGVRTPAESSDDRGVTRERGSCGAAAVPRRTPRAMNTEADRFVVRTCRLGSRRSIPRAPPARAAIPRLPPEPCTD